MKSQKCHNPHLTFQCQLHWAATALGLLQILHIRICTVGTNETDISHWHEWPKVWL